jgi:CRISPR-associated exonuclease Cas4
VAETVSGGDVGRFAYCPLNWKLSLAGNKGAGGEAGIRRHEQVGERVDALELYQKRARQSLSVSFYLALFATSAAALGVEFFVLRERTMAWWTLVFLSVLWTAGSLYLIVFHYYYSRRAGDVVRETRLEPGEIRFADTTKHSEVLVSKLLPLRGRPDYVIERGGFTIPVELKTGRTPPAPYDSHALQLAVYCHLVGETYGKRPPYGILAYPDRTFEVPYSDDLEDRLVRTLMRMELARRTGDVHRDHNSPKRCLGCSRREGCPERLA